MSFVRKSSQDFNTLSDIAGLAAVIGIWSDGTTMWVAGQAGTVFAFNLRTKARDSSKDIDLSSFGSNVRCLDLWSDGTTMWVSVTHHSTRNGAYAFVLSTRARDSSKDILYPTDSNNQTIVYTGIWSDGTTMWVARSGLSTENVTIIAYNLRSRTRDNSKDFLNTGFASTTAFVHCLWGDGITLWLGRNAATGTPTVRDDGFKAFNLRSQTREPQNDFDASDFSPINFVGGAWSNDDTFWISSVDINLKNIFGFEYTGNIVRKSTDLVKRFIGSQSISKYYIGSRLVWEQGSAPSITALSANPSSIDLDTRATGNVTVTFGVTGSTHNRLYNTRSGANIPLTTSTTAVFAQPQQPTTYRLVSQNATGAVHRDVAIDVTKNPTIANFRRSGFQQIPGGGGSANYRFSATITGLPRPSLGWRFGNGQAGNVSARHFVQGANPYTWTIEFLVTRANANADSLVLTATNASGSVTATLANINS